MAALRDQPGAGGRRNPSAEANPSVIFRDASAAGAKSNSEAVRASGQSCWRGRASR